MNKLNSRFSKKTKDLLARRVNGICSFPGCGMHTIGPKKSKEDEIQIVGEAAHIYAASPRGPRYNEKMTDEERRHHSNGIWMCSNHAKLIDNDQITYTAETLLMWKKQAEERALENLKNCKNLIKSFTTTLIQIGQRIIFEGRWKKITHQDSEWTFTIDIFRYGTIEILNQFITGTRKFQENEKFIIVESQGDGRIIKDISIEENNGSFYLIVKVEPKSEIINPEKLGSDLALKNRDIFLDSNGNLATVQGTGTAIQRISTTLSTLKGEYSLDKQFGSLIYKYYYQHKDSISLLERLIKIEIIRLSLISFNAKSVTGRNAPLNFINHILEVKIQDPSLHNEELSLTVSLEWGNEKKWEGIITVFIPDKSLEEIDAIINKKI